MKASSLLLCVLVCVFAFVFKTLHDSGDLRVLYPHGVRSCAFVDAGVGNEDGDVLVLEDGRELVLFSSDDRATWFHRAGAISQAANGRMFVLQTGATKEDVRTRAVVMRGYPHATFHPHGVHVAGRVLAVVVHRARGESVEVFRVLGDSFETIELRHERSVSHELFKQLNDVVMVGERAFYATNYLHGKHGSLQVEVEKFLRLPIHDTIYCQWDSGDAKDEQCTVALTGTRMNNGLAVSRDGKSVFVVEALGKQMGVYERDAVTNELRLVKNMPVPSLCDNAFVDSQGRVMSGCHPQGIQFVKHVADPARRAPSQVVRFDPRTGAIEELLMSLGDRLSASSFAVRTSGFVVVGGVLDPGLLVCDMAELERGAVRLD